MPGGRPAAFNTFTCPNCGAFYQVVKVEAGPETDNREIKCRACGGPLVGREGKFVLKYFLLRKAISSRRPPKAEADDATLIERVELASSL
jgi:predicted Zn finger-like uncharacterized protein